MAVLRRYLTVLLSILIWSTVSAALAQGANIIAVDVTGKAALSQKGAQKARRNALEDALYLAALKTGADLSGITISSNGKIIRDVVTLGTQAQLVDFNITGERNTGTHYEVSLKAFFARQDTKTCAKPAYPSITMLAPRVQTSQTVDIHYAQYAQTVAEKLNDFFASSYPGRLKREQNQTFKKLHTQSQIDPLFDYKTLQLGRTLNVNMGTKYTLSLNLLVHQDKENIFSDLRLTIHDAKSFRPIFAERAILSSPLPRRYTLRALNVLVEQSIDLNEDQLVQIAKKLNAKLINEACTIRSTKTIISAGKVKVAIGAQAGLRKGSLAYIVDGPMSWTLLEVQSLSQNSAVLKPVNALYNIETLGNQNIRFIEGTL